MPIRPLTGGWCGQSICCSPALHHRPHRCVEMSDRREVARPLADAQTAAERLGDGRNDGWTAFGRSNLRIHATSADVDLGDPDDALTNAAMIDPADTPADLLGHRCQLRLDTAWAYGQRRNDAVLYLIVCAEPPAAQTAELAKAKQNEGAARQLMGRLSVSVMGPDPGVAGVSVTTRERPLASRSPGRLGEQPCRAAAAATFVALSSTKNTHCSGRGSGARDVAPVVDGVRCDCGHASHSWSVTGFFRPKGPGAVTAMSSAVTVWPAAQRAVTVTGSPQPSWCKDGG